PPTSKITLEIFLNHYNIFENLTFFYILAGLLLFILVLVQILRNKNIAILPNKVIYWVIVVLVLLHTIGLGVRWYVGGHAPWSNAYESMIYIAWAAGIAGVVFFSRSFLALATASFLAGTSLFVAHLGLMDPQIGNLVPVLKSYWLNIHVSIITASYGFLGLCFMLGVITLVLFIFRSKKYQQIDQTILTLHTINEMSMILGLAMLTIGNFLGGVWANESWGRYWGWDAKETWALISIAIYAVVLHVRFLPKGGNPYIFATLSVIAFYSILMTYFGVNFYLSGLHSYAAGDPIPIPVFLYYFVAATILLIIFGARKRDLEPPKLP
ncbi:MAG: cytochrome c biogenesis protein CcsA, partial [Helicobacter sp.]|nr:cytochrome c biogenesis protein CcsA [Helicobacter sp.]